MPAIEIIPRVFFALRPEVKQNAHYISDFQILYPAGSVMIVQNYYEKRQRFINLQEKCIFLEMIELSPSRKLAAIIQNGEKGQILVFDMETLKKRRTLNLPPDSTTNRFETVAFTHDDAFIIAITGEPDWNLVLYNWERGKLTSVSKAINTSHPGTTVAQICCSPSDNSEICLVGQSLFRLLSRTETVWRQYGFQKADQINITTAAWLSSSRIICGTADAKLLFLEHGDLKAVYNAISTNIISLKEKDDTITVGSSSLLVTKTVSEGSDDEDIVVRSLIAFAKGFAYSCRSGYVHLFEKESPYKFRKRNVFRIADTDLSHLSQTELNIIRHLSINVSQDKLLATTNRTQLYTVRLWGPDIKVAPEISFKLLGEPLHHGIVNGLTMCMWKPLFATSGQLDRTVRLWNYETESVQIVKHYSEEIYSIHLHPTGNLIAIGFMERVSISIVLLNDIQHFRSIPIPKCDVCQFSLYGQYIAAVDHDVIQIYGTIAMDILFTLKGHIGKINALQWTSDDKKLASCTSEGEIFIWETINGTLLGEIRTPGVNFLDIAVSFEGLMQYAVDSEGLLREFSSFHLMKSIGFRNLSLEKIIVSRSNFMMFLTGGASGVLSVKMPLTVPPEYSEFLYHASRINQLMLSYDDQTLVTISNKGAVIIWKLNLSEGKAVHVAKDFVYSTEILINKKELEKKISTIKDLSQKLYELEIGQFKEMRDTERYYCDKIKELHETYTQNIQELKEKIEQTEEDQDKQLISIKKEIDEMKEKQTKEKADLVENYTSKLLVEYEKVRVLEALKNETVTDFERKVDELVKLKEEETNELIRTYEQKLADVNTMLEKSYEENVKNIKEHVEIKNQLQNDTDREIVETKAKYEEALKEEREENSTLREEAALMRKKHVEAQKERDDYRNKLEVLQAELMKHQLIIQALEKDVADLKADIVDRDKTVEEKDEAIFTLKKQLLELDKFKFVLDYKIKELNTEIDPKDREIREKKEQIADMEIELENLKKINSSLELQLVELKEKIKGTEKEVAVFEKRHHSGVNAMRQIKIDIYNLYQNLDDFNKIKTGIKALNDKYQECNIETSELYGESDLQRELLAQREFLEKTVKALNSTLHKKIRNKTDKSKIIQDNVVLLEELNSIRKSLSEAVTAVKNLEKLFGLKQPLVPSEVFHKLQLVLKKYDEIQKNYQEMIDDTEQETEDVKIKVKKMQEKLVTLLHKEIH